MTDWIIAISSCITAITIVVLWKQLTYDHDRSRRENAINLSRAYINSISRRTASAYIFAESLDFEQAKLLYKIEPFDVDAKLKHQIIASISGLMGEEDLKHEGNRIYLSQEVVAAMRWEVICFLNNIEAVLSAWRHHIADREIIEEEFSHMVSFEEGYHVLKHFRNACGGVKAYPAIEEFVTMIENRNRLKESHKQNIA